MITRLRQRLTRPVINHDDSGSMILALFAIMILTSLVSVVLMVTISQQAKTRKATDFTFAGQAADTAVNDALLMANLNGVAGTAADVDTYDVEHPRVGVTGDFKWSWYSTPGSGSTQEHVISATGCRATKSSPPVCTPSSSRTVNATLAGTAVDGIDNSVGGGTAFNLKPESGFGRALFADTDLIMHGASKVESYDSGTGAIDTGFGQVATNGLAAFDGGQADQVDGVYFSNTQTLTSSGRCTGLPCNPGTVHNIRSKFQITNTKFIDDNIAACMGGQPLRAWVASEAAGHLVQPADNFLCYASMNFDVDTDVNGTTDNPLVVYVNGPITIGSGKKVNVNASDSTPVVSTLQIFSSGPLVSIDGGAASLAQTEVAWTLWAPKARCATNPAPGGVTVYGSTVCSKIFTHGAFTAKWDEALRNSANQTADAVTIWDITAYRDEM